MVSKRLMGAWSFFDFCLLTSGILTLVVSIVWRGPDLLRNMVIGSSDLTAGLVLGVSLLVTWAISIMAIIQPNHSTSGLKFLNWVLILNAIEILAIGTPIWFYSLRERANFHEVFSLLSSTDRIAVQDKLQCCGYFNSTDLAEIGGSFCANTTFVQVTNNATGNFCVGPLTHFADVTLNDMFTTVYGFMAVVILLFLATLCVINMRIEDERFRKIDAKRGRGFV